MAEAAGGQGRTRLLAAARDLTAPPLGTATGAAGSAAGALREAVAELGIAIPGALPRCPSHAGALGAEPGKERRSRSVAAVLRCKS